MIACAFADDELKQMFNTFLRDGIPGGKKALVGRFGPYRRCSLAFSSLTPLI